MQEAPCILYQTIIIASQIYVLLIGCAKCKWPHPHNVLRIASTVSDLSLLHTKTNKQTALTTPSISLNHWHWTLTFCSLIILHIQQCQQIGRADAPAKMGKMMIPNGNHCRTFTQTNTSTFPTHPRRCSEASQSMITQPKAMYRIFCSVKIAVLWPSTWAWDLLYTPRTIRTVKTHWQIQQCGLSVLWLFDNQNCRT